jgi:hypothetical protein
MEGENRIKVTVSDAAGGKVVKAELPSEARVERLISALVARMSLPPHVQYDIQHKQSGKILKKEDTLAGAGVKADDTLRLVPTVTAG